LPPTCDRQIADDKSNLSSVRRARYFVDKDVHFVGIVKLYVIPLKNSANV